MVSAVRALATIGDRRAAAALVKLASDTTDPNIRLEAVTALGTLKAAEGLPVVQDFLTDPWPTMRAAALRAAAAIDPGRFLLVLSGMEPDPQWVVRAALAEVLATMAAAGDRPDRVAMLRDEDQPGHPVGADRPGAVESARRRHASRSAQLKEPDLRRPRHGRARSSASLKPAGGAEALREAWQLAGADAGVSTRARPSSRRSPSTERDAAMPLLKEALNDKDWAVRVHAAGLLAKLDPAGDYAAAIRPAPGAPLRPTTRRSSSRRRTRRTSSSRPRRARSSSSWRCSTRRRRRGTS